MSTPEPIRSYLPPEPALPNSSNAIISLVCGIMAWLGIFGLGGILAVIFGHLAKKEIREKPDRIGGDGLATAGLVLGYSNIALTLFGLCIFALVILGVINGSLLCLPFLNNVNSHFSLIP